MSTNYSTIQQHQPLRVPQGWGQQEKALIIQLDEVFDDIYRRFGRLGMNDMSKQFRITIDGKYDVVSGIAIDENGIEVTGAKYVKIKSGATFDVESTNFGISSEYQYFRCGDWEYNAFGILRRKKINNIDSTIYYGEGQPYASLPGMSSAIYTEFTTAPAIGDAFPTLYVSLKDNGEHYTKLRIYGSSTGAIYINNPYLTSGNNHLGSMDDGWDIYGATIRYDYLIQNSSRDVKHNILDMEPMGRKLDALRPVTFAYNDDPEEKKRYGLIYEETEEVMPDICVKNDGDKSINYMELVPMLLKEIQELRARVAALEK